MSTRRATQVTQADDPAKERSATKALAPEINILPYRTDSRFLKFFMQASSGEKSMMPVIIGENDKIMVEEIRKAKTPIEALKVYIKIWEESKKTTN